MSCGTRRKVFGVASDLGDWTALWHEAAQIFSPGAPIDEGDLFAGRVDQVRELISAVYQRGQHAIIFGERGVGKTSLANTFTKFMHSPVSRVVATRVNCDGVDSFSSLWRKALADLDLSDLLPENCNPDDVRRALREVALNNTLIIVLDEFDRLNGHDVTTLVADTIKSLSDHSVPATIVVVGVADSVADLLREHASVGRALVEIPMPRMNEDELLEIIEKRLPRLNMSASFRIKKKIIQYSQGLPHYAHLITLNACRAAIEAKSHTIAGAHFQAAISKCIDKAQQSIRDAYYKATVSPRRDNLFAEVLLSCALAQTDDLGFFPASAVADPMTRVTGKAYTVPNFAQHLKDFCSPGRGPILEQRGSPRRFRYRFRDPLMQPYIVMHGIKSGLLPSAD